MCRVHYRAIIVSGVEKVGWLAIVGSGGGFGHLGLQMAKAKGINVIGVDARDKGIELSKRVGCGHVFNAREGKEAVVKTGSSFDRRSRELKLPSIPLSMRLRLPSHAP